MTRGRVVVLILIAAAIALTFLTGLDDQLDLDALRARRDTLVAAWQRDPLLVAGAFAALNILVLALSIPGVVIGFSLAAGAIFGPAWGTAIALGAVVIGDSLAFLLARYVFRDAVERRFAAAAARTNRGVRRDGAFYLLALRLLAIVPYFMVNLTMGLTRMPLRVFAPVSFLGLLPVTFLYVQAGTRLAEIERPSDVYSPGLLASLAALALFPLAVRLALRRWRTANAT